MQQTLVRQVRARAGNACEYCRLPQEASAVTFEIDHIIAQKHRGPTVLENLALSCFYCNSNKGPNIAGIDPKTGQVTQLFHPRLDAWSQHFAWQGALLIGRTAVGRATIEVLEINEPDRALLRESLLAEGNVF